jgi:hypothetical protein
MRGDQVIDDDPVSGEGRKRADLIEPNQAAVALDVHREIAASFLSTWWASNRGTFPIEYSWRFRV